MSRRKTVTGEASEPVQPDPSWADGILRDQRFRALIDRAKKLLDDKALAAMKKGDYPEAERFVHRAAALDDLIEGLRRLARGPE